MAVSKITASLVKSELDDHKQKHADKLDPELNNARVILFGDKGDDGLCSIIKDHESRIQTNEEMRRTINKIWLGILGIIGTIIVQMIFRLP